MGRRWLQRAGEAAPAGAGLVQPVLQVAKEAAPAGGDVSSCWLISPLHSKSVIKKSIKTRVYCSMLESSCYLI